MPSLNNVSYNSSRVQRAYRINNIETMRLNGRIQLLEKERMHRQRLTNQDIRLISLTLDYIQTCSGHSVEGVAPDDEQDFEERREREKEPCFLYGERIVSRKRRRNLRPQSAMEQISSTGSKQTSETASVVSGMDPNIALRPQSSPNRRKPSFITHLRDDESEVGLQSSERSRSGASTPRFKPEWTEVPPTEVTQILLRAASTNGNNRKSVQERHNKEVDDKGSSSLKRLTRSLRISSHSGKDEDMPQTPYMPGRGARITDILNDGKAPMSASYWKSHLNKGNGSPVNSSYQRQSIMDSKKAMNNSQIQRVQTRVNTFVTN